MYFIIFIIAILNSILGIATVFSVQNGKKVQFAFASAYAYKLAVERISA